LTFDEIVAEVMDRQNLSSEDALARVKSSVNERYRWLRTATGLQVTTTEAQPASTEINNRLLTFRMAKIRRIYIPVAPMTPWVLNEQTMDYMRNTVPISDPPQNYALYKWGATTVQVYLDSVPTTVYTILADGDIVAAKLDGPMIPPFPEDFHDALIYGAMEVEYQKKNDAENADRMLTLYINRRNELIQRMAVSGYLRIYQNKSNDRSDGTMIV
jgi:hypothetical protein